MSFKQPQFTTTVTAKLDISATNARRSGLAAYYNNDYHYEIYVGNDDNGKYIGFYKHIHDMGVELTKIPIENVHDNNSTENKITDNSIAVFRIDTDREKYTFSYAIADKKDIECINNCINTAAPSITFTEIGSGLNAGLSTEGTRTMTFTGTLFSLFSENGDGMFVDKVMLTINPDVDYKL